MTTSPESPGALLPLPDPVGYISPSDPFSSTAFSWPGTQRVKSRHTDPVYTADQMRDYAVRAAAQPKETES